MSGPTLVIELAEPLSPAVLGEFRALMVGLSSSFDEKRPGVGDEGLFEAEHADEPEVEAVLGFRPTHAVNVSACCNGGIDHVATALLTAAVMDVIGGVAKAELLDGQVPVVAGLPGVLGIADDDWTVLGTAEFLRAWAGHPAFRLLK
ncbi:DUF6368 family protein [Streptomyces sp. NPDC088752]|uniref:DUF6368 family protein n=1 Tax=Streptomyces sp. NPDC088752 TaxID=3154963 RepID=UPI003422E2C1